jgi:hypothetical protein
MASKKVTKKGNPSPRKAQGRGAQKRIEKPFRLEVGKTYETRNGKFVAKIVAYVDAYFTHKGEWVGPAPEGSWDPTYEWFRPDGRTKTEHPLARDLVREVPGAKRPVGRPRPKGPTKSKGRK